MLSAISRRNAVLHCAACSKVRGGTRRVLLRPAIDALAITAIPQVGTAVLSISATAARMTPPMPRDPPRYPRLVRRGGEKKIIPRGQAAGLGERGEGRPPPREGRARLRARFPSFLQGRQRAAGGEGAR